MRITMKEALLEGRPQIGVPIGIWRIKITVYGKQYGVESDLNMVMNSAKNRNLTVKRHGKDWAIIQGDAPGISSLTDSLNRLNTFEGKIEKA